MGSGENDEMVEALRQAIHNLLVIKGRLPLLQAVAHELDRVDPGHTLRVRNDAVLRLVRDSFDMLVVDLWSLREGVTARRGMFNMLRDHLDRLRLFTAEDVDLGPVHHLGSVPFSPAEEAAFQAETNASFAKSWNERFERLFPGGPPVTGAQVDDLITRFRADTAPTERDRNRVRAHRYEEASKDGAKHFQPLPDVEAQIRVFEGYFNDLFLVLQKGTYAMLPLVAANAESTARDITDLILIGSINRAVVQYGLVPERAPPEGPPPWYWYARKRFFEAGGSLAGDGKPMPTPATKPKDESTE